MDPLATYAYLVRSRGRVLAGVRQAEAAGAYHRAFPIGPGTIAGTLTHMLIAEWYYIQRMEGHEVPPYEAWEVRDEAPPPLADLERRWAEQASATRAALGSVRDWDAEIAYRVMTDGGERVEVTASARGLFTQLVLHEMHHRAQVLNMLRQAGVDVDGVVGEIDFNAMEFGRAGV